VWRTVGVAALGASAFMAWHGVVQLRTGAAASPRYLAVYWGIFALLLLIAVYMALLDLRFIRLQYVLAQRKLFADTLGSEEFRRELREAQDREQREK